MGEHILVIGATLLDAKGQPADGLEPGTSNPAVIRVTRGGTARNVAENLGRLGAEVILVSAVGDDLTGQRLVAQTAEASVNVDHVQIINGCETGAYLAILEDDGSLSVALDDVRIMNYLTPDYLNRQRRLFRDADMVMMDGSLTPEAMKTIIRLAATYDVPLCADPSSTRLAPKLRPYLSQIHLVVPNEIEAAALCQVDFFGFDPDASLDLARLLVHQDVKNVVISLSDFGLVYATSDETGHIPARYSQIVDTTGTGDALTAAIIFGLVNDLPAIESIRLGAAAASLTLQTAETVVPDLSLDMLYDHLII
jgi:pseudouridine kinase